uniref:Uncharacterized protein n=1 Tax=Romanomermis culicivorax TaxID=13658 RepID=A0A915JZZ1_ROMCU
MIEKGILDRKIVKNAEKKYFSSKSSDQLIEYYLGYDERNHILQLNSEFYCITSYVIKAPLSEACGNDLNYFRKENFFLFQSGGFWSTSALGGTYRSPHFAAERVVEMHRTAFLAGKTLHADVRNRVEMTVIVLKKSTSIL